MTTQTQELESITRSLTEIKDTLKDLTKCVNELVRSQTKHDMQIDATAKQCAVFASEIRDIQHNCIEREHVYKRGQHFLDDVLPAQETPVTFSQRIVASAASNGIWIVITALISIYVPKLIG